MLSLSSVHWQSNAPCSNKDLLQSTVVLQTLIKASTQTRMQNTRPRVHTLSDTYTDRGSHFHASINTGGMLKIIFRFAEKPLMRCIFSVYYAL